MRCFYRNFGVPVQQMCFVFEMMFPNPLSVELFAENVAVDFTPLADYVGLADYLCLFLVAVWGAYCCVILWRRIGQLQFSSEDEQDAFLDEVHALFVQNQIDELVELCDGDPRAVPQLTLVGIKNRQLPIPKLRNKLTERFQRDVLVELDYRSSWIQTIIKAAPMLGLFGTVIGMMGAFGKLSAATEVSPDKLASDIMFALITTACGLSIAIPLVLATAGTNVRLGRLEDFVGSGLTRLVEIFGTRN